MEARLAEAEDQCRFERAVPLINDAGLSLDPREFLRPLAKPSPKRKSALDPTTLTARVKATKNSDELDDLAAEVGGTLEQGQDGETARLVTPTGTLEWSGDDYEWTPEPETARIIFDNGGGTTLQIGAFAHHYISPSKAAKDLLHWLAGSDVSTWDDHDPNATAVPSSDEIRNGGYLVTEVDRANPQLELIANDLGSTGWMNAAQFAAHLRTEQ